MTHSKTDFNAPSGVLQNPPVSKCSADPSNSLRGCDGDATGGELFTIPETKSPRLKWLERHHIKVKECAPTKLGETFAALHGMDVVAYGGTEDEAIMNAAIKLNLRLWNEV